MTAIHYFPRYTQRENFITNNTLLLLVRLREFNHFKFEAFIEQLCEDNGPQLAEAWFGFQQQEGTPKSVVDGFIAQDSVKIAVETKLADNHAFDLDQLTRHLTVFREHDQHKLLLLLSPSEEAIALDQLEKIRGIAWEKGIHVVSTSFASVVKGVRDCLSPHDEEMISLVDDYEAFCSDMVLLPRDSYTLFVAGCRESFDDNVDLQLYYHPGNRRKARYLGVYKEKVVQKIGRISKVVACNIDLASGTVTAAADEPDLSNAEKGRIVDAARRAQEKRGWDLTAGHKFYLCDDMTDTAYKKTSDGGMLGWRYFDLEEVLGGPVPQDLEDLAAQLRTKSW